RPPSRTRPLPPRAGPLSSPPSPFSPPSPPPLPSTVDPPAMSGPSLLLGITQLPQGIEQTGVKRLLLALVLDPEHQLVLTLAQLDRHGRLVRLHGTAARAAAVDELAVQPDR